MPSQSDAIRLRGAPVGVWAQIIVTGTVGRGLGSFVGTNPTRTAGVRGAQVAIVTVFGLTGAVLICATVGNGAGIEIIANGTVGFAGTRSFAGIYAVVGIGINGNIQFAAQYGTDGHLNVNNGNLQVAVQVGAADVSAKNAPRRSPLLAPQIVKRAQNGALHVDNSSTAVPSNITGRRQALRA